jgi:membrane protease YdiL (CAAX protease family)
MTTESLKSNVRLSPAISLLIFFALAYAVMWSCFITVAVEPIPARTLRGQFLLLLGAFAPSLAALFLVARDEGSAGVATLLRGVIQWRVAARWYVFAATYTVVIKLAAAVLHRVSTGAWPRFGTEPWYLIPLAIVFSTPFQAGEEIGWRGYALPRLAARFGLARASILLGVIWGCWHLPQFFIREADTYRQSFFVYVLGVIALSVAIAWLWDRAGRSLLLPMLLHAAWNNSKDIVPSSMPGATGTFGLGASLVGRLTLALLWVCAAWFLFDMPKKGQPAPKGTLERS